MTLDSKLSKAVYQGNDSTTVFPFAFKVWNTSQITVTVTDAAGVSTDVTSNSAVTLTSSGGSVTYPNTGSPLPTGAKLAITRNMPFTQGINLTTASRFDPQVLEDGLDQATAERQQTLEMMARAVILPATSNESPQEVVQSIYAARDDATAAASSASSSQSAAAVSAGSAADSAATAAQIVEAATATAVTAASNYADAAANSADNAAQSALDAAAAAPDNLVWRVEQVEEKTQPATTTSRGISRVATLADMGPGATINNGPAFLAAGSEAVTTTPTPNAVPQADASGRIHVGFIPGTFVGDIRLLPFRAADLATHCPGWLFCNGDQFLLASAVGIALNALPANFKADWGIVVASGYISIPKLFHTDGRGFYVRAVNGTARQVGSVATDKFQGHTHGAYGGNNDAFPGPPYWKLANSLNNSGPSYTTIYGTDGSNGSPRIGTETSVLDVGMTPAIFLNV